MCTKRHNPTLWRAKPALGSTAGNLPLAWVNSKWTGNFTLIAMTPQIRWNFSCEHMSTEITDTWIVEAYVASSQSYLLEQTYSIKYQDYRSKSPQHIPNTSQLLSKCSGSFPHLKIPSALHITHAAPEQLARQKTQWAVAVHGITEL